MIQKLVGRVFLILFAFIWLIITLAYCIILNFHQLVNLNIIDDKTLAKVEKVLTYVDLTSYFEFEHKDEE